MTTETEQKTVCVNPEVNYGSPSVRGITTAILAERFVAGESISDLAADYPLGHGEIEEALRFELRFRLDEMVK